jgi:NAD-dependent DNA ligase
LDSMCVVKFKPNEVKTSEKVKEFYRLQSKKKPYTQTWADTIKEFDRCAKEELKKKQDMESAYRHSKCRLCDQPCVVRQIRSNRNNNQGKWFLSCIDGNRVRSGHTWTMLGNSLPREQPRTLHQIPKPSADGANKDSLKGKRFVSTGTFSKLGGGEGLSVGKEKLKELITSFGGAVTGSISGKTNYLVVGDEPGAKKLEEAEKRGVPKIDLDALLNMTSSVEMIVKEEAVGKQNKYYDV